MGIFNSIGETIDKAVDEAEDTVQQATGIDFGGGETQADVKDTNESESTGVTDNPGQAASEAVEGAGEAVSETVDTVSDTVTGGGDGGDSGGGETGGDSGSPSGGAPDDGGGFDFDDGGDGGGGGTGGTGPNPNDTGKAKKPENKRQKTGQGKNKSSTSTGSGPRTPPQSGGKPESTQVEGTTKDLQILKQNKKQLRSTIQELKTDNKTGPVTITTEEGNRTLSETQAIRNLKTKLNKMPDLTQSGQRYLSRGQKVEKLPSFPKISASFDNTIDVDVSKSLLGESIEKGVFGQLAESGELAAEQLVQTVNPEGITGVSQEEVESVIQDPLGLGVSTKDKDANVAKAYRQASPYAREASQRVEQSIQKSTEAQVQNIKSGDMKNLPNKLDIAGAAFGYLTSKLDKPLTGKNLLNTSEGVKKGIVTSTKLQGEVSETLAGVATEELLKDAPALVSVGTKATTKPKATAQDVAKGLPKLAKTAKQNPGEVGKEVAAETTLETGAALVGVGLPTPSVTPSPSVESIDVQVTPKTSGKSFTVRSGDKAYTREVQEAVRGDAQVEYNPGGVRGLLGTKTKEESFIGSVETEAVSKSAGEKTTETEGVSSVDLYKLGQENKLGLKRGGSEGQILGKVPARKKVEDAGEKIFDFQTETTSQEDTIDQIVKRDQETGEVQEKVQSFRRKSATEGKVGGDDFKSISETRGQRKIDEKGRRLDKSKTAGVGETEAEDVTGKSVAKTENVAIDKGILDDLRPEVKKKIDPEGTKSLEDLSQSELESKLRELSETGENLFKDLGTGADQSPETSPDAGSRDGSGQDLQLESEDTTQDTTVDTDTSETTEEAFKKAVQEKTRESLDQSLDTSQDLTPTSRVSQGQEINLEQKERQVEAQGQRPGQKTTPEQKPTPEETQDVTPTTLTQAEVTATTTTPTVSLSPTPTRKGSGLEFGPDDQDGNVFGEDEPKGDKKREYVPSVDALLLGITGGKKEFDLGTRPILSSGQGQSGKKDGKKDILDEDKVI